MSSEDQKPIKKSKVELDEMEDGMSLGSIFQAKKKKLSNGGSKPLSNLKKEELQGEDGVGKSPKMGSGSVPKGTKVKKEERFNSSDDDYDETPSKKSSAAKRDMVHFIHLSIFLSRIINCVPCFNFFYFFHHCFDY